MSRGYATDTGIACRENWWGASGKASLAALKSGKPHSLPNQIIRYAV
jgi:hypothetical protein